MDMPSDPSMTASYESLSRVTEDERSGPWPWFEWIFWSPASTGPVTRASTAQAMDSVGKGVMHASAAFFGPALLQLALQQVKSQEDACDQGNDSCLAEAALLFGFWRPSSVLTTSSVLAVLTATVGIPFLGAYIDRQIYGSADDHGRYTAGKWTAYILVALHLGQTLIQSSTWVFFWVSHTVAEALNMIHQMIILAYLQDLTTDIPMLTRHTSYFALLQFIAMLLFFALVAVYAKLASPGEPDTDQEQGMLRTSRFANGFAGCFGLVIMGYAWAHLFSRRKQNHHFPGSIITGVTRTWCEDLYLSGQSLARLIRLIRRDYPALQWLVVTLMFSPSMGSGSYFSIFSTLHKVLVEMNSAQIGLANLIALAAAMVGAQVAAYVGHRLNALLSFQLSLFCLIVVFACTAWFVHGPQDMATYYFLLAALGMVLGWLVPTERVLYCTLAPSENQSEMMGLLVAVHTALAFIPPLLFSVVTQLGYSMQWAIFSQNILLICAISASCMIGPFEGAVAQARRPAASFDPRA